MQDLRYALRTARRNPGFAAVAVLTLALGIGVNTAVFSVVDTVLLRTAPYADPARLVTLHERFPRMSGLPMGVCPGEYLDYRDRTRAFSSVAGYEDAVFDLTGGEESMRIEAQRVTHTLFRTLGVSPLAGRTFLPSEDQAGGASVALLSYEFWQRHFGGSRQVLGAVVRLNEQPYTVIGIMPAGFEFPFTPASTGEPPALWIPTAFTAADIRDRLKEFPVHVVARLKPGISFAQAADDVHRVADDFQRDYANLYTGNLRLEASLDGLESENGARARPVLLTLAGAVVFVLLIACVNVTNLLLARAAAREREMALRNALGASAGRLAAQLLSEGLLLTLSAAALGCALAQAIVKLVASLWPSFVAGLAEVHVDLKVLAFTLALSIVTGLACGLAPAVAWIRPDIGAALKQAGRQGASREHHRFRSALVVLETSSAVVLSIGAGLLIHSFLQVLRVPIGFSPRGVLIARTTFNRQRYPSSEARRDSERQMTARLLALPGVTAASLTTHIPLADDRQIGYRFEGEDVHASRWADNALVDGGYFAAMGIPLLHGRTFGPEDTPQTVDAWTAPASAIVNESMARRIAPGGDALGRRLVWGGRPLTIVGIVGDVHIRALDAAVNPTIYNSVYQVESGATTSAVFIVRTRTEDPASLARAVRDAIRTVDRDVPVFDTRTLDQVVARSLETRRFAMAVLSSFAVLAVALALIGLYSVLSYAVARRTSELGVRFALGATRRQVVRLVVGDGLRLTAVGIGAGALLGAAAARAMSRLLFGVAVFDLPTFAITAVLLLLAALMASLVPALRASRVDPMAALRSE